MRKVAKLLEELFIMYPHAMKPIMYNAAFNVPDFSSFI